ncbi:hypothetical protein F5Y15DRAFT_420951 [Xylariaceae sp. FL0016]|nr:hypothetical protein F5Y15DRAFT_420951 [Xylariaceae sp. FL0016]
MSDLPVTDFLGFSWCLQNAAAQHAHKRNEKKAETSSETTMSSGIGRRESSSSERSAGSDASQSPSLTNSRSQRAKMWLSGHIKL